MNFRNIKSRTRTDPDFGYQTINQFYTTDDDLRYGTGFLKKSSNRSNVQTKQTIQDLLGQIGNRIKTSKSVKRGFAMEEALRHSRASFVQQTSILYHNKTLPDDELCNEILSKDDLIDSLKVQNQSLKLLLQNQVKRIDQQSYDQIASKQQQIQYLTTKIQTLKSQGYLLHPQPQNYTEYQLQLQTRILQLNKNLQQSSQYKNQLSSIITKLLRENIVVRQKPEDIYSSRRSFIPLNQSNSLKIKIKQCIQLLDGLVK